MHTAASLLYVIARQGTLFLGGGPRIETAVAGFARICFPESATGLRLALATSTLGRITYAGVTQFLE